jgi:hypothetical protein
MVLFAGGFDTPTSSHHTATLLSNGKVLIAGGYGTNPVANSELYDPVSGTFGATATISTARSAHTATPLANGKVLVTGGRAGTRSSLDSVELLDPP